MTTPESEGAGHHFTLEKIRKIIASLPQAKPETTDATKMLLTLEQIKTLYPPEFEEFRNNGKASYWMVSRERYKDEKGEVIKGSPLWYVPATEEDFAKQRAKFKALPPAKP